MASTATTAALATAAVATTASGGNSTVAGATFAGTKPQVSACTDSVDPAASLVQGELEAQLFFVELRCLREDRCVEKGDLLFNELC